MVHTSQRTPCCFSAPQHHTDAISAASTGAAGSIPPSSPLLSQPADGNMTSGAPVLAGVAMLAAWRVCCVHSTPEAMAPSGEQRRQVGGAWTYDLPGPCGAAVHSGIKVAGTLLLLQPTAPSCVWRDEYGMTPSSHRNALPNRQCLVLRCASLAPHAPTQAKHLPVTTPSGSWPPQGIA